MADHPDIHPLYRQRMSYIENHDRAESMQRNNDNRVQIPQRYAQYGSARVVADNNDSLQERSGIYMSPNSLPKDIFGLSGIMNVGNTCYLNSAIQALAHTHFFVRKVFETKEELSKILLTNAPKILEQHRSFQLGIRSEIPEHLKMSLRSPTYDPNSLTLEEKAILLNQTLTFQLIKLLEIIWNKNGTVNPSEFIKIFWTIRGGFFRGFNQHDSEEAYTAILDQIQTELQQDKTVKFPYLKEKISEFCEKRKALFDTYQNLKDAYPREFVAFQQLAKGKQVETPELFDEFVSQREKILNEDFELKKSNPEAYTVYNSMITVRNHYKSKHTDLTVLFTSFSISTLRCPTPGCGFSSIKFEPSMYIQLPIPCALPNSLQEQCTLQMCMQEYCKEERLNTDNRWKCDKCHESVQAFKKLQLWSCPPVLCIQLKRFIGEREKITRSVQFPLTDLDVREMTNGLNDDYSPDHYRYTLQCVINHVGSLNGGHYYAYCKHETSGRWFEFNDSRVSEIRSPVTNSAYVLYYVRQDIMIKQ